MKKPIIQRVIITVRRKAGLWAAEEEGVFFDTSAEKDIVKASAAKRAQAYFGQGTACQIRVSGEHGFQFEPVA
jgi:hypothetical protein